MLAQHARVNRHVVDALLGLLFNHFAHQFERQILRPSHARNRFIHRHRAHRHRRGINDRFANSGNVATSGKIHDGVRAIVHGVMQLLQLLVDIRAGGGVPDVRVDLALRGDANGHRLKVAVMDVGGNDAAPARYFAADQLRFQLLALRNVLHLLRDHTLPRQMHLRYVPVSVRPGSRRFPLFNPAIAQSHRTPSVTATSASRPVTNIPNRIPTV